MTTRIFSEPGYRGHAAVDSDRLSAPKTEPTIARIVKLAELRGQIVDVAVVNLGLVESSRPMVTKPVGVFPLLDLRAILPGPSLGVRGAKACP